MKLKGDKKTTTLTLGDMDAKAFGIDTSNGVIFDILRNKMYSNKIAAVAREITSNSRDANRENKKIDTPIEVHIVEPSVIISSTDMQIVFKDYGTGITPDRMANIFLNYGASTKRTTNKQTGGFGLGAKTPFAYTDTFTVVTVYQNGSGNMKDIYTASITDRKGIGSGEMILFTSEATDEPTGTSIVVPIDENDREEFEREVHRATSFWKVKPKLLGFRTDPWKFKEVFKASGFNIIQDEDGRFVNNYLLVIDGIPYEVDKGVLGLSSHFLHNTDLILCFHYNNGDLTISANREAVQYDRLTKTKLIWRIRQVKRKLEEEVNTKFAEQKTYLDACIFSNVLKGNVYTKKSASLLLKEIYSNLMPNKSKMTFNGKTLAEAPSFKWHDLVAYQNLDSNNKLVGYRMNVRKYGEEWYTPMYWMDVSKRDSRKNATLIDEGGFILISSNVIECKIGKDAAQDVAFKEAYDKMVVAQAEEKLAIEELGLPIKFYSTVVQKVLPKGTSNTTYCQKTNDVKIPIRCVNDRSSRNWDKGVVTFLRNEKTTQNGKKYIYIVTNKLSHFTNYSSTSPELPSDKIISKGVIAAKLLKLSCVCVAEGNKHYFESSLMMTVEEAWGLIEGNPVHEAEIIKKLNHTVYSRLDIRKNWYRLNLKGRVSQTTLDAVEMKKQKLNSLLEDVYDGCFNHLPYKATVTADGVEKELKALYEIYPLLKVVIEDWRYGDESFSKEMNKVMDAIDKVNSIPKITKTLKARLAKKERVSDLKCKFNIRRNK